MARIVMIKLSDDDYKRILEKSREEGYVLLSDYIRSLLLKAIRGEGGEASSGQGLGGVGSEKKILAKLERKIQDMINPWTQKIEELNMRVSNLYEQLEEVKEKISALEGEIRSARETHRGYTQSYRKKKTAIERLREQGVVFESDVYWLKDRRAFFEKLRREGAIIISTPDERIAVDRAFWISFLEKVENISSSDEEEVKSALSEIEFKLFVKLRRAGVLFFDGRDKKWIIDFSVVEGQE